MYSLEAKHVNGLYRALEEAIDKEQGDILVGDDGIPFFAIGMSNSLAHHILVRDAWYVVQCAMDDRDKEDTEADIIENLRSGYEYDLEEWLEICERFPAKNDEDY